MHVTQRAPIIQLYNTITSNVILSTNTLNTCNTEVQLYATDKLLQATLASCLICLPHIRTLDGAQTLKFFPEKICRDYSGSQGILRLDDK